MSKSKNNELKFSIRNLIDTTAPSCEKKDKEISNSTTNHSLKRMVIESESSSLSSLSIPRPIPLFKPKIPHPCWSFLSQLTNKNINGNIPFNSSLIFLNKMNQFWEQIQRTQISPSITTTTTTSSTTENDDVSDEEIYMDTSSSSIHRHIELDDDDEEEEEIDDDDDEEEENDDDEDEEEEGECSTSTGDKHNTTSNSEENDKLKNYPCTQCGKVKLIGFLFHSNQNLYSL
jgi:hypothetical protein